MSRPYLIVLSGDAGAGKDSVAKILVETRGWQLYSLAGPLKRFAYDLFGFTEEQLYGPSSARNEPDPRWKRPCKVCKGSGKRSAYYAVAALPRLVTCEPCEGQGKINDNSPRRILQLLGEEWLREMIHPDALTMRAVPDIAAFLKDGAKIVVNDARNDNDRDNMFYWMNASRVDVRTDKKRKLRKGDEWRTHKSEMRKAKDSDVEYILRNDEVWPFPTLGDKVDAMLKEIYG